MNIATLLVWIGREVTAFVEAPERREYLLNRSGEIYDQVILPLNLPGPDSVIDPMLRWSLLWLVASFYDGLAPVIARGDTIVLPELPETTEGGHGPCDGSD